MNEKQLISTIKELRNVKPAKEWVSLTKNQIFGEEPRMIFSPYFKPAFAGLIAVCMLFGMYGLVKGSLPGDILYTVRKIAHKSQAIFVSDEEKPAFQLKLANARLEDLFNAPAKNLAPTITEFQANIFEATKNLIDFDASTSDPVIMKKIVDETIKLEENKERIESLGVVVGTGTIELENALGRIVYNLIIDLEERTLNEMQENILNQMKELSVEEKYLAALELYLINQ